ncbi:hypothetical protein DYB36_000568 [Aphanomyces astaci]|uniref:FYVE-type domain-containing protein n=1 Tax=Aphanomyces astaci TaxID=112090 RepID=A0A397AJ53_APHAT|nr:hypothetical protein DYB36_000568 [Aphanomyces astaci]
MSSNQVHHSSYPRIEFTQDVYEKHLGNMERIAALALAGRSGWDKATATPAHGWSRLTDSAGWQVLSLQAPSPGVHEYLCFGTLRTSLVALQHAFYVKNTYEFRALSAVMYEDTIADAALLNITHRQTAADVGQFFGVKYLKLLVQVLNEEDQEQEYVYLECKVCFKFFNLLRRKHHCRRCGSSMCGACTVALHCVDRPTKSRTSEAVAVEKFCKSCLVQAKIDTMRVDGDAGRGGGRRRGGSDDGTTHSAVMSGSNKRVAHLHSPTRNANGDRTYSSTT